MRSPVFDAEAGERKVHRPPCLSTGLSRIVGPASSKGDPKGRNLDFKRLPTKFFVLDEENLTKRRVSEMLLPGYLRVRDPRFLGMAGSS
jgi:hypothetical protein